MPTRALAQQDLDHILIHTASLWPALKSERLFLTGGTGFFGHWLLESFLHANRTLFLNAQVTILTRNPEAFRTKSPHLTEDPAVTLLEGDVRTFPFPSKPHKYIIHAAADSGGQQAIRPPYELAESILEGTRRTLQFALATGATRLLFTSTGAVYGRNLTGITHIPETQPTAPDPLALTSSYDEAKRMAEHLCIAYAQGTPLEPTIARCFAFLGPHLPLDAHFAIGNLIRDAIAGSPIHIQGDGTPLRSYLYAADLAIWLWTILFTAPRDTAYNVGSEEAHSIAALASLTSSTLRTGLPIEIDQAAQTDHPVTSYVPSTTRAEQDLGLRIRIPLDEAIRRTAAWHGFHSKPPLHRSEARATAPQ